MSLLKVMQWALGLVISFYLYKALLGKMSGGDGLKFGVVALIWIFTILVTSGFVKIN